MNGRNNYFIRSVFYVPGFLVMTMGVAISVKSGLGVSPVSSIPYTITCVTGIDMEPGMLPVRLRALKNQSFRFQ